MKLPIQVTCPSCQFEFHTHVLGKERVPPVTCLQCASVINVFDPLSITVVGERLFHRAEHEIVEGDFTISIICSAIATEAFFAQAFTKWKSIKLLQDAKRTTNAADLESWETEYRKQTRGSFLNTANVVSEFLVGMTYDAFIHALIAKVGPLALTKAGLSTDESVLRLEHIHTELFQRRNKIMHQGKVDFQAQDASAALKAGRTACTLLKMMDMERFQAMEAAWRESVTRS